MMHLIKHFVRRVRLWWCLIVWAYATLMFLGGWYVFRDSGRASHSDLFMPFMIAMSLGAVQVRFLYGTEEFDLSLPFRRRTLFVARNIASLLILALIAIPLSAATVSVGYLQGRHLEMIRLCTNQTLMWGAIIPLAVVLWRFVKPMPPFLAAVIAGVPAIFMFGLLSYLLFASHSGFLPSILAVVLGPLAWILGIRQCDRVELIPNAETESVRAHMPSPTAAGSLPATEVRPPRAPAHPEMLDNFSPFLRVMARSLWLRWWYPPLVALQAGVPLAVSALGMQFFYLQILYSGVFLPHIFKEANTGLVLFVRRETIFRCLFAPIASVTLLATGITSVAADSVEKAVWGLAAALTIVFSAWAMLPSEKERKGAVAMPMKYWLWLFLLLSGVLWQSRGIRASAERLCPQPASAIVAWFHDNPVIFSCAMLLAIVFFWWRAERNFRHFEPKVTA